MTSVHLEHESGHDLGGVQWQVQVGKVVTVCAVEAGPLKLVVDCFILLSSANMGDARCAARD